MAIIGIERLIYAVDDLDLCSRFFDDFGLVRDHLWDGDVCFRLPEGSRVILKQVGDPSLPQRSQVAGAGVHELVWGVDEQRSLDALVASLRKRTEVVEGDDGIVRFVTPFGIAMGLKLFSKVPVVTAPDPINAPGHVRRLNQHRKWRRRAFPKVIQHVVFAIPDFEDAHRFMIETLNFRLSDHQRGFGTYLRADGTHNHHNILFLNAKAHLPDMDGSLKFHHANFGVEDIDELMIGANTMVRRGWEPSHFGMGRHRIDSALFYYLPCPAGGEAEYGADGDYVDDAWVPRDWDHPLFAYAHYVHDLPPFLQEEPVWHFNYLTDETAK